LHLKNWLKKRLLSQVRKSKVQTVEEELFQLTKLKNVPRDQAVSAEVVVVSVVAAAVVAAAVAAVMAAAAVVVAAVAVAAASEEEMAAAAIVAEPAVAAAEKAVTEVTNFSLS
jgi:hypothetical protein